MADKGTKTFTVTCGILSSQVSKNDKIISMTVGTTTTNSMSVDGSTTITYNGTENVGLGSQYGSIFNITVSGTYTNFEITMNGKTLSFNGPSAAYVNVINNVDGTVYNGTTNMMQYISGDTDTMLYLIPGVNTITLYRTGGSTDFKFDYTELFL